VVKEPEGLQDRGDGQVRLMSHEEALAKVGRLRAVTVERGATPAEAATPASLAQRLIGQIADQSGSGITPRAARGSALAPGVHVVIA
jgi:hypothetical protein